MLYICLHLILGDGFVGCLTSFYMVVGVTGWWASYTIWAGSRPATSEFLGPWSEERGVGRFHWWWPTQHHIYNMLKHMERGGRGGNVPPHNLIFFHISV